MGDKVTPTTITSLDNSSTATQINNNNDLLADEFDNVVYRDGSQDMQGHLNMNSKRILNLAAPEGMNDALRLQDLADFNSTGVIETESNFLQSGTGAVSRTTQSRLRDYVSVKDFGAVGDGVTNDTSAIAAAVAYAVSVGKNVFFPAGIYLAKSKIDVPKGPRGFIVLLGEDRMNTKIIFDGAISTGFMFDGVSGYSTKGGGISNLGIYGQNGAVRGVTFRHCSLNYISFNTFYGFAGAGIRYEAVLVSKVMHNLLWNCGNATEGEISITSGNTTADTSTTIQLDHNYIAEGGTGCIAGITADRITSLSVRDGAIESCGAGIIIGGATENTQSSDSFKIDGVSIENCDPYIKVGQGWTGSSGQASKHGFIRFSSSPSGGNPLEGVQLWNCTGIVFDVCLVGQNSGATATYALKGTGNVGIVIRSNPGMYGNSWPYVTENGVQRVDASPKSDFNSDFTQIIPRSKSVSLSGTAQTLYAWQEGTSVIQGGIFNFLRVTCAASTTISFLRGERDGAEITILANDSNGTLVHNAGTFGFTLPNSTNLNMKAGLAYKFRYNASTGKWGLVVGG